MYSTIAQEDSLLVTPNDKASNKVRLNTIFTVTKTFIVKFDDYKLFAPTTGLIDATEIDYGL